MTKDKPLWKPTEACIEASAMYAFMQRCNHQFGLTLQSYPDLHAWSVAEPEQFWRTVWDFCDIKGDAGARILTNGDNMLEARFFPDAMLNFAENLLSPKWEGDALVFRGEDKVEDRWSWHELRRQVSRLQQAYRAIGIGEGDRVAAMMPNMPQTIACMLAAASLGAVWSSCSPDFGEQGVLDRFRQIDPKLFIACDAYWYAGKLCDVQTKVAAIAEKLGVQTVIVNYAGDADGAAREIPDAQTLEDFVAPFETERLSFAQLPFSQPLYILFSSGTTGVPKCIIHSAGGTLLQHLKEHRLHCGIQPGEKLFYYTTCGWMMWNWLASGLACGATLCLYDGSPFSPDGNVLLDYAEAERFAVFGTSAKYIDTLRKSGLTPRTTHDLRGLRLITSTGSPLSSEGFNFVYEGIKQDVQLASISGGTDIVSCFVLGNPLQPVWREEIQGPGLGLAMDVWDEQGQPLQEGKGELVCTKPFPSMPIGFWNDPGAAKYHAAYFERYPNVWCHGDFAEWTAHGGVIIHGRSDATLNPGGVRIGTAEIYNQVEQLPQIVESLCIGQDFEGDVRIILFVRLVEGVTLDADLERAIRTKIRTGASPRHVPARIVEVSDIPRTKSGKITELAVRDIVHGREVKNSEALANPEALGLFRDIASLRT